MTINEYLEKNSFHDSYISNICYDTKGVLKVAIVQLLSELNIDNYNIQGISADDQVEIEVKVTGIDYICHEDSDYLESEITSVEVGSMNGYDIILVKVYNYTCGMLYREIYIRGQNLQVTSEILRKMNDTDK